MSVIKTDLLQNRLGTSHPAVTKADFVKAWINLTGTPATPVIRQALNVTSLVDNGLGYYGRNFTAGFASVNFADAPVSRIAHTSMNAAGLNTPTYAAATSTDGANASVDVETCIAITAGVLA